MISVNEPCPGPDWMRCKIGKQCLLSEKWCDHRVDCIDGTDEENCSKFHLIRIDLKIISAVKYVANRLVFYH